MDDVRRGADARDVDATDSGGAARGGVRAGTKRGGTAGSVARALQPLPSGAGTASLAGRSVATVELLSGTEIVFSAVLLRPGAPDAPDAGAA